MARLNIQLPDNLLAAAKKAAHKDEISLSQYIRGLLINDLGGQFGQEHVVSGQIDLPIELPPRCVKCITCDGQGCEDCHDTGWSVPDSNL